MKYTPTLVLALLIASCTDDSATLHTLNYAGYKNVQLTGWEPFACAGDDNFSTGFRATNPAGQRVEGVVCCGLLKSCTVRF